MSKQVLVPVDGSEQSERALEHSLESFPDASISLLTVFSRGPPEVHLETAGLDYDELRARRREMLAELVAEYEHGGSIETAVVVGRPAREIIRYADDHDVDQIVMGSHGRDGASRVLLGSVAETVARRAPVPVTIVR
ncbi:universal stress protein UspA [Halobiforma lacisalsi AJ5]|uniref:Universal stress protein UspA n=1 Tax=Natronobacterium lacisalsi AJ5 TaxID=358396 RepID=M0LLF0_NATLA|nr:universal stress protein [Halobiforma lacisalsi]APW98493.1 universal stress protein UspA [Halobiforma lacisalsi AJ5]EMA33274.1 UspA domain-containing protein [Halobiforma lacisalsi AJ5]